jgi:hypothetical protein
MKLLSFPTVLLASATPMASGQYVFSELVVDGQATGDFG